MNPQIKSTTENKKPQSYEVDLSQFQRWHADDPSNREIKIEIRREVDHTGSDLAVWVCQYFDGGFELQRVWDVEEIDLESKYKKQLREGKIPKFKGKVGDC